MFRYFNHIVRNSSLFIRFRNNRLIRSGDFITKQQLQLENANEVIIDYEITDTFYVGLVKDYSKIVGEYFLKNAYWPKFERFLQNNKINYSFYDIFAPSWLEDAIKFDVVIWHMHSHPYSLIEARNKIFFLEKKMGKKCIPSFDELWLYENKIGMHSFYKMNNLPEIPTYVFFRKSDAISFLENASYPLISKLNSCSSSKGVEKIENKRAAIKLVKKSFSFQGRTSFWPFERQKNYVLFQKFIPNAEFDLRVIVVGQKLFGYYRFPTKNDFRASGSGQYAKKDIDFKALDIAWNVKQIYKSNFLATDFIFDPISKQFLIIESSIFIGIDTCEQLSINGVAGFYQKSDHGYTFVEGKYWVQELLLEEAFKSFC